MGDQLPERIGLHSNFLKGARIARRRPPGTAHLRATTIRRALAVALLVAAVVVFVVARNARAGERVVVAAHDLRPGVELAAADIAVVQLPPGSALPGMLRTPDDVIGQRVAGAIGAGESITRGRLLTARLPAALIDDDDARLVPVRPADPAVAGLLRTGDVVDVLDEEARVLAADAVVAVPATDAKAPVLLAMAQIQAHRVAAASLANPLTIVLH